MAKENFDAVMVSVLAHEGGYVNHPKDPGGETNFGISKRSYPRENIKGLTKARAKAIYRRDFWNKISGDKLPRGVDLVTMDASVNSGASRGVRWTQTAAGLTGKAVDGVMGQKTLQAIAGSRQIPLIKKACAVRLGFLYGLRTWGTFGKGWSRRIADVEAMAVAMAATETGDDASAAEVLTIGEKSARRSKVDNAAGGHTTVAGGAAAGAGDVDTIHSLPYWAPIVMVAFIILVALWFYGRSRHASYRAEAYKRELSGVGK